MVSMHKNAPAVRKACVSKTVVTCEIKHYQNICKNVLDVVTCKIKHFYNIFTSTVSRGKPTAVKHFCKICFILHVTTVLLSPEQ